MHVGCLLTTPYQFPPLQPITADKAVPHDWQCTTLLRRFINNEREIVATLRTVSDVLRHRADSYRLRGFGANSNQTKCCLLVHFSLVTKWMSFSRTARSRTSLRSQLPISPQSNLGLAPITFGPNHNPQEAIAAPHTMAIYCL